MNGVLSQNESCVSSARQKSCVSSGCCKSRARAARWRVEQPRAERAFCLAQPRRARQAEQQHWLPPCCELKLAVVDASQLDQTPFSGARTQTLGHVRVCPPLRTHSKAPGVLVGAQQRTESSPGCRLSNALFELG